MTTMTASKKPAAYVTVGCICMDFRVLYVFWIANLVYFYVWIFLLSVYMFWLCVHAFLIPYFLVNICISRCRAPGAECGSVVCVCACECMRTIRMWFCECAYRMLNCTFKHFISLLVELPVFVYSSVSVGWFRTKFNDQSTKTWQFFFLSIPSVCHIEQHNYGILVLCSVCPCASSSLSFHYNGKCIAHFVIQPCTATRITNLHR